MVKLCGTWDCFELGEILVKKPKLVIPYRCPKCIKKLKKKYPDLECVSVFELEKTRRKTNG